MRIRLLPLVLLLLPGLPPCSRTLAAEPDTMLIRNVRLIGRQGSLEDVVANILIAEGKLEVVTKDDVSTTKSRLAFDAQGGFLLGKLEMGRPPSFLILDRDPREDFGVLLDTEAHVRFAVHEGIIIKNELPQVVAEAPGAEPKRRRWLAYNPPPLVIPLDYWDSRKWNRFDTRYVSGLFNGALALDRLAWLSQHDASKAQVGDLSDFAGGEIRALRFGLVGRFKFKRPWIYTLYGTTSAFDKGFDIETTDSFAMMDYRLDIPLPAKLTLSVGKQKEPISLERLTSLVFLPWQERASPADAFLPARNHGVVLNGTGRKGWLTWAAGAFNDWISSGTSFHETSTELVTRVTWVPFVSEDESNLLHLGIGLRHTSAKQGIRVRTEPEFDQSPVFVDTGPIGADGAFTYDLEAYWRRGPVWLGLEYIGAEVDSTDFGDPSFHGYHVSASWAISGEMRPYRKRSGIFDPLPVARSVRQGGWGALEAAIRYSTLDLSDGLVEGGEMDIYSIGLNWWLTRFAQVGVNYRYIDLDRLGVGGRSSGINGRLLLILD